MVSGPEIWIWSQRAIEAATGKHAALAESAK